MPARNAKEPKSELWIAIVKNDPAMLERVIAADEDTSRAVCAKARYSLLHTDFPGRMCISGNLAIPFSPSDLGAGPAYEFHIWHTLRCDDPMDPVRVEWKHAGGQESA